MVKTHTSFKSYRYTQTTDGVNDYNVGTDGVSGFSITDFLSLTNMTINVLVSVPTLIDSSTSQKILCEISNTARSGLYNVQIGAFTATLTLEYIGVASLVAGTSRGTGVKDGGSISAAWHMFSFTTSAMGSATVIDGVKPTNTIGSNGDITNVSTGFTATKLSIMGSTSGSVPYGCEWREFSIYSDAWTTSEILDLYRYYTRNGSVPLGNSDRSAARYAPKKSTLIDLWKGNVVSTALKATKTSAHDLVLTNF